jgi:CBS domain-containing protein
MEPLMPASAVMDPHPTVLRPTDIISTAVEYIMQHRYRSLPVVDEEGRYLGVFGVNCLLKLVLPKAAIMEKGLESVGFIHESLLDLQHRMNEVSDQPISVCMSTDIATVGPDTPLVETLLTLYRTKSSVPVLEPKTGKLLGVISYWDVGERILSA